MALTLTRNLKLRIDSNLTANSKYNLERLDLLGSTFLVDSTDSLNIRSQSDILIEPNSADIGGSGVGGILNISSPDHLLDELNLNATEINIPISIRLFDQATSGSKYLAVKYKSDLNGSVDTVADRNLLLDLDGSDRSIILSGSLSLLGGADLTLNLTGTTSVILPVSGTLSTLANTETLTNKSMSGLSNTFTNLPYASLVLTGSIVNADVSPTAEIVYSKLDLTTSIQDSDVSPSAAIQYSKLDLVLSITDNDIAPSAGISANKIGTGNVSNVELEYLNGATSNIQTQLDAKVEFPDQTGNAGKYLRTDGTDVSWEDAAGGGTVTSVAVAVPSEFSVSGSPITGAGTITIAKANQTANQIYSGPASGGAAAPSFRALVLADLPALSTSDITEGSNLYFTDERAQDSVGNILVDSASIDFTYSDATPSITAAVLPAGVNHNVLQNYVANEHIDHTSVSITTAANSGLSGGGTIAATRSLAIDPNNAPTVTPAGADLVLIADASNANALSKTTVADIVALASGSVSKVSTDWITGDGTTKVFAHNIGSLDVSITVYDKTDGSTILVDSSIRTDLNTVTLTSSSAPGAAGWKIVVIG